MISYTYLIIASIAAILSLFSLYVLYKKVELLEQKASQKETSKEKIDDQLKDLSLTRVGLSQFKILDTKQTAQMVYDDKLGNQDLPGNAKSQAFFRVNQKNFEEESNISFLRNKQIYG